MAGRFAEWLQAINYSPKTRVNYTRDVKVFLEWLADNTVVNSLVDVTPAHLQQYQIALYNFERSDDKGNEATKEKEAKRLSVGTQAARLAAVRKFFSWLLSEQQIAYQRQALITADANRRAEVQRQREEQERQRQERQRQRQQRRHPENQ